MPAPAQPNRSLMDGIEVLLAAVDAAGPVGVRELARQLGFEPTRTQRLLGTLAHLGLLQQDDQRRYRPGPGLPVLSAIALSGLDLLPRAVPSMDAFARAHAVTVALGTLWRDHVAYLAVVGPGRETLGAVGGSRRWPLADSSIGILLLGWQTPAYARRFAVEAVWPTAVEARERGWVRVEQGEVPGERVSVAAPVMLPGTTVPGMAIAVAGPGTVVEGLVDEVQELGELVVGGREQD